MARQKQSSPLKRTPSGLRSVHEATEKSLETQANGHVGTNGNLVKSIAPIVKEEGSLTQLIICVGGIYASFLTWGLLQERITTVEYGSNSSPEHFTYSVVLNTVQSTFAAIAGFLYLRLSNRNSAFTPAIFPSPQLILPLLLVAFVSSLASPFGYASLGHIDYITFILAKSCKLLPVMFLHLTIFRKSYPMYKYAVVAAVTAGVVIFTLHNPSSSKKASKNSGNTSLGLFLLAINLLFDGLNNTTQDQIFEKFKGYSGPQMMVAQNVLSTILTGSYLVLLPYFPPSLLSLLSIPPSATSELSGAISFLTRYPQVFKDVLAFAACGAVGQIFIYLTLNKFSSILLVTVTVTRKMFTMILSVIWFGHRLTQGQWLGVGLVFAGIGVEGLINRHEKIAKDKAKSMKLKNGDKKEL